MTDEVFSLDQLKRISDMFRDGTRDNDESVLYYSGKPLYRGKMLRLYVEELEKQISDLMSKKEVLR